MRRSTEKRAGRDAESPLRRPLGLVRSPVPPGGGGSRELLTPAEFARELLAAHDDDREHFWVIFLNSQNGYTGHHLVSTGSLSAAIVHPRLCAAPHKRGYVAIALMWCSARRRWSITDDRLPDAT